VGGYPPWEPGASHFGLVVPDAGLVWSQLVEFRNRKKPVAAYAISDIAVGYVGFEVSHIEAFLAKARDAGAHVVSQGGVVKLNDKSRAVLLRDPDVGGFIEPFEPAGRAQ
jgi:hypothetical protein